ncbi:hypothetical protein DFH11DRAFT_853052 [Phellopilus nigrolimitatus]|nr:hypothetical protein DFH11DRAFT_853052 [Phellopilus nigrolimitatus]
MPAAFIAAFFTSTVSISESAIEPACTNCTSVANIFAHVPVAHPTMGLRILPNLTASIARYSSIPAAKGIDHRRNRGRRHEDRSRHAHACDFVPSTRRRAVLSMVSSPARFRACLTWTTRVAVTMQERAL